MATQTCGEVLQNLHNAILALVGGSKATSVSFGDRSTTFTQANLKDLKDIYRLYYRDCGSDSGLPNLSATVERGPPARFRAG